MSQSFCEREPVSVISAPYCEHKECCTKCKRRRNRTKRKAKQRKAKRR